MGILHIRRALRQWADPGLALAGLLALLANLFVDEAGDHLVDENGDRLGEI